MKEGTRATFWFRILIFEYDHVILHFAGQVVFLILPFNVQYNMLKNTTIFVSGWNGKKTIPPLFFIFVFMVLTWSINVNSINFIYQLC